MDALFTIRDDERHVKLPHPIDEKQLFVSTIAIAKNYSI
jgi:hypothetical protein